MLISTIIFRLTYNKFLKCLIIAIKYTNLQKLVEQLDQKLDINFVRDKKNLSLT